MFIKLQRYLLLFTIVASCIAKADDLTTQNYIQELNDTYHQSEREIYNMRQEETDRYYRQQEPERQWQETSQQQNQPLIWMELYPQQRGLHK